MFIINPLHGGLSGLFASHPSTAERIARLRAMTAAPRRVRAGHGAEKRTKEGELHLNSPSGQPSRKAALAMVSAVLRQKRSLDSQLDMLRGMDTRDAGFARALASGTLRHLGILEAVVRKYVPKAPPPHKAGATSEILLLGACELLILETAPHAAVDAANILANEGSAVHFKPLINAVPAPDGARRRGQSGRAGPGAPVDARLAVAPLAQAIWRSRDPRMAEAQQMPPPLDIVLKNDEAEYPESKPLFGRCGGCMA